jgi:hypothetical protein
MNDRNDPQRRPEGDAEDPGAFIGHEPERATETIPGGVNKDDERVAALATQSTGVGRPDVRGQESEEPSGHREGPAATDDAVREAGQNE